MNILKICQLNFGMPKISNQIKKMLPKNLSEKDIETIENKIASLEGEMNNSSTDYVKLLELQEQINNQNILLEEKMERWEYLSNLNMQIENYRKEKFN